MEFSRESHDEVYRLLLEHGSTFEAGPAPQGLPLPEARSCFANAYQIASRWPDRFTYYEGVGVTWFFDGIEAVEESLSGVSRHAWCVDAAGVVLDTTWHYAMRGARPAAYCGLPLPLDVVRPFAYSGSRGTFDGSYTDLDGLRSRLGI